MLNIILALIALQPIHILSDQLDIIENRGPLSNNKAVVDKLDAIALKNQNTDKKKRVPCSRRNSLSNPIDNPDEWLPTYKSGAVKASNDVNILKILRPEHTKNEISVVKSENVPYDPLFQKTSQQIFDSSLNPQRYYKPSQSLLLGDDNQVKGNKELLQHQLPLKLDIDKENILEYQTSNTKLLENKKSQADETKIIEKPDERGQDTHEIFDNTDIKRLRDVIIMVSVKNLPNNSNHVNLSIAENHEYNNTAYRVRINNDNKESDNCITEQTDDEGYIEDSNTRRLFSDAVDIVDRNMDDDNLQNESARKVFDNEKEFLDPAKGVGIKDMSLSGVSLLRHSRVCYACSTTNNPACWFPDRRTTVKYCRQGRQACVTKTFKNFHNKLIVTRDCGESCDDTDVPGPKYESCSICHTDMCNDTPNGATSLNIENFILGILAIFVIQCTF